MAKDGFPFGYFVFTDCSKFSTFFHCFQDLKYDIKVNNSTIYAYDSKEFHDMVAKCCLYANAYIIKEITKWVQSTVLYKVES